MNEHGIFDAVYKQITTSTTQYRNFFFPASIRDWNSCDVELIESETQEAFKQRLPDWKHLACTYCMRHCTARISAILFRSLLIIYTRQDKTVAAIT